MSSSSGKASTSDAVESLLIDVRASTDGFAQDISTMRNSLDGTLVTGFTAAGSTLETSLVGALAKGSAAFTNLRSTALSALDDIAQEADSTLFSSITSDSGSSSSAGLLGVTGLLSALSGLPGRATGGAVSPGQAYMVGESGPELFVPTSAGSIASNTQMTGGASRNVQVAINVAAPAGTSAPQALQRSSRQVASAVRRALTSN